MKQAHCVHSAFNVLEYKGFLNDEGINTLEAIQMFYDAIGGKPRKSGYVEKDLIDFCPPGQSSGKEYHPVVIISHIPHGNHAVALKEYSNDGKTLTLTLLDSAAQGGETVIQDRIQYSFSNAIMINYMYKALFLFYILNSIIRCLFKTMEASKSALALASVA